MVVSITLDSTCAGGGHAGLAVSFDAEPIALVHADTDDLLVPLSPAEKRQLVIFLARARVGGMTRAQVRTAMLAGISVTL